MTERVLAHPAEARTTPHGGRAVVTGRRPEAGLYDSGMATYDTGDTVDG